MKFVVIVVLMLSSAHLGGAIGPGPFSSLPSFMAFCDDGDGSLSEWVTSRYEAYLAGREHEQLNKNHRWEILVRDGGAMLREPVCSRVIDGPKPETVVVQNTCGKCLRFTVARTNDDRSVNAKEFKIAPQKGRTFRKLPNSRITVDAERDCDN